MKKEICLWAAFAESYHKVVNIFSVQLVDAWMKLQVEALFWMDVANVADVDTSK